MIYCDIGNTTVDLYRDGKREKYPVIGFDPIQLGNEEVTYISVNRNFNEQIKAYDNWQDAGGLVDYAKYYPTMGIDRIMVCEAIEEGIIVDAGSAITVDIMKGGKYQGGYISLGLRAAHEAYARLSGALDVSWNFEVDLAKMAKNTPDAVTIGFLAPLIMQIRTLGGPLYLTGGDAGIISRFFPEAVIDNDLIFKGMNKLTQKGLKC